MKNTFVFIGLLLALTVLSCSLGASALGDRLDVTWPDFNTLPITTAAAKSSGWTPFDSQCGTFGTRYVGNDNDLTILLIFDASDNLAGVQVGVSNRPNEEMIPPWELQDDTQLYTITFFFMDPSQVCSSTGRKGNDIGDRLAIRNGATGEYIEIPLQESSVPAPWVLGHCFVSMGTHYWYNISAGMDCNYFYPVGIMYESGQLVTFLVDIETPESSGRWEHPPTSVLSLFFFPETMPQCLLQPGITLSTMHFFLTNPIWNTCLSAKGGPMIHPM